MELARVLVSHGDLELWEGDRMVVAIDRDLIVKQLLKGQGVPALSFVPPAASEGAPDGEASRTSRTSSMPGIS